MDVLNSNQPLRLIIINNTVGTVVMLMTKYNSDLFI